MSGKLSQRFGVRWFIAGGLALVGLGLLLIGGREAADSWTALVPGFIVTGAGAGLVNVVIADVALSVVPKERSGMASGINDTFRQVGVSVGIAAWGALFLHSGSSKVESITGATGAQPRHLVEAVSSGQVPAGSGGAAGQAARDGFLSGFNEIMLIGGGVAIAGALLVALLVREGEIERDPVELIAIPEPA